MILFLGRKRTATISRGPSFMSTQSSLDKDQHNILLLAGRLLLSRMLTASGLVRYFSSDLDALNSPLKDHILLHWQIRSPGSQALTCKKKYGKGKNELQFFCKHCTSLPPQRFSSSLSFFSAARRQCDTPLFFMAQQVFLEESVRL